ncbi:glycosyltransferase family 4 protein [Formosa sp. S-31]|uniref:glycosyltransferase family 4 protein n=1 Tax=Formosa sp. S-31 TaxID=2790949 RepID=UPI003EBA2DAF
MKSKRILIIASHPGSLTHFRGDFIFSLIKKGYSVFTASPCNTDEIKDRLKKMGATPLEFNLQRTGINPLKDIKAIKELQQILKERQIDLVFPYTVKPVIYGSLAANSLNIPVISLITGLGFTFSGLTQKAKILQRLNEILYKISIRKNKVIVFQNKDDYQLFLDRNILTSKNKVAFVSGSGVNLNKYKYRINNNVIDSVRFLFVARLIKEKGIDLYLAAAEALKNKYPKTEFHVIGIPETSPTAISISKLNELHDKNIIIYHGKQSNVAEHLHNTDVFVLPTYYREGIPRSILEALSVGLPIITTNTPGCKETVITDKNGILISPQNYNELKEALEYFILNKEKIKNMGINSRKYAEDKFDVNIINNELIHLINDTLN